MGNAASGNGRQAGVTLIELVVALTVVALTLAAAATGLRLLGRSGDRGTQLIARHDMLSRGVDALRRDIERLERVVRRRERDAEFVFHGDEKSLVFVAVEPPVPSEPGPYFILYSVEQGGNGGTLVRSRAPYDGSAKDIRRLRTQDDVVVLEGPFSLRFSYFERKEGQDRWVSRWRHRDRLPGLIRLDVGDLPPLVFRPRSDAEVGCVKDSPGSCSIRSDGVLVPPPAAQGTKQGTQERKN
jgi:prepilin-type N-terminal cleavage/methylation domain-containing protein